MPPRPPNNRLQRTERRAAIPVRHGPPPAGTSDLSSVARIHSFEPIEDRNAEILILGSMPGRASLMAGQYYAHAQNAFWRIIAELLQFDATAPYETRLRALMSARIALWEGLPPCSRGGGLGCLHG